MNASTPRGDSGAWYLHGRSSAAARAACRRRTTLAKGLFVTSEVLNFEKTNRPPRGLRSTPGCRRLTRTWGDGYGYLMVATGRADVMVDPMMALWDAAALPPILEEAGGTFSDWQGNRTIHAGEGLATNGLLAQEALSLLRQA